MVTRKLQIPKSAARERKINWEQKNKKRLASVLGKVVLGIYKDFWFDFKTSSVVEETVRWHFILKIGTEHQSFFISKSLKLNMWRLKKKNLHKSFTRSLFKNKPFYFKNLLIECNNFKKGRNTATLIQNN